MKVKINREHKFIYVECWDIVAAGWFGFNFARNNADLVEDGWEIHYYPENDTVFHSVSACAENISDIEEVAKKIRNSSCCHNCCCDKGK